MREDAMSDFSAEELGSVEDTLDRLFRVLNRMNKR